MRFEIADEDMREQVNKEYQQIGASGRSFFLDKAHRSMMSNQKRDSPCGEPRSRSVNAPTQATGYPDLMDMKMEAAS